jgi:hypothetical protein
MSEQKVDLNISKEKMAQTNTSFLEKRFHNHLNLLDGNKLLKGGLIK